MSPPKRPSASAAEPTAKKKLKKPDAPAAESTPIEKKEEVKKEEAQKEVQPVEKAAEKTPVEKSTKDVAPQKVAPPATGGGLFSRFVGKKAQQASVPEKKIPKAPTGKKKSDLASFLTSLNNIGLGKEKATFIENLAILLNSGLSIVDALRTIEVETRTKAMKKIILRVIDEVESGIALWQAMDNQNFFSPYALALIRIGEESGALSKNMEYLAVQQEKDRSLRSKVKMAMIYPVIVLTLTTIVTLGLAWFVLPQLVGVLLSLNAELPLVTRMIIVIANFFKAKGIVAVPLFILAMIFIALICRYTRLRGPTQQLIFRMPGIGPLARYATIARFGVILGSLLKAGVPMVESIRSLAEVTDTVYYRYFFFELANEIEVGQSFGKAFASIKGTSKLIPASVQQLVVTGEKSGRISEMLLRISEIYEKKAEEMAQKLPVILEPILLVFIGGLVGTIAFAIIVPIYSIVGSVGR